MKNNSIDWEKVDDEQRVKLLSPASVLLLLLLSLVIHYLVTSCSVMHSHSLSVSLHSCSPVTYLYLCLDLSKHAPPSPRHLTLRVISCFWVLEIFLPFSFT